MFVGDMDDIKYAAYRTAMKLRFIQKRLKCKYHLVFIHNVDP